MEVTIFGNAVFSLVFAKVMVRATAVIGVDVLNFLLTPTADVALGSCVRGYTAGKDDL